MQEIDPNDIRLVAMNLLARREHLSSELERKLAQRFGASSREEIERVLGELSDGNLLCDRRFAETYVRSRSNRGYGPERIRQELREKGVQSELLEEALESLELDWGALARGVRIKKFGAAIPEEFRERARQMRFLAYRGFGGSFAAAAFGSDDAFCD